MKRFNIGDRVQFKSKDAIIADHLNGKYLLWDSTGEKELDVYSDYPDGWVPDNKLTLGWN